jgi:hypothetical protein
MSNFYMKILDGQPDQLLLPKMTTGAYPVYFSDRPAETIHSTVDGDYYAAEGCRVYQKWNTRERTPAEISAIKQIPRWRELPMVIEASASLRADRNARLAASDWTQFADAPADAAAWAAYRQELRDVPGQEGFPWSVEWPTQPA